MRQKTINGDCESLCPPNFPKGLVSLSELNPTTQALWQQSTSSTPYLVKPMRCWHPSLPSVLEIYTNVWRALRSRSDYAVFVKGEKLKVLSHTLKKPRGKIEQKLQERIEEAITTAMFQSQRDDLAGACLSFLLNVQLERLSAVLEPPEKARSLLHVCEDSFQVQVNVVPSGAMVDLHYGKDLLQLPAYVNTDEPFYKTLATMVYLNVLIDVRRSGFFFHLRRRTLPFMHQRLALTIGFIRLAQSYKEGSS